MEPNRVYKIPKSQWHNTVTTKGTKLILIEKSDTSMENSDIQTLDEAEIKIIKELCR